MRRIFLAFALVAATMLAIAVDGRAQSGDQWQLIGRLKLDPLASRESVDIVGQPDAGYRAIRLEAKGGDVVLSQVQVVWRGAPVHTEARIINLRDGERTRPIEAAQPRNLERVGVVYKAGSASARLTLEVWGQRPPASRSVQPTERGVPRGISAAQPPPPPATRGVSPVQAGEAAANPATCIEQAVCTPVPVFFGTNRQRKDEGGIIQFTKDRSDTRVLGQATVTVPRAYRAKGEIPRPSWWDLLKLQNPYREDPARHFTILGKATRVYASEAEFLAAVKAAMAEAKAYPDHAFLFVHGFNVSFEHALYRTAQIAYDLGQDDDKPFGTAFLYSWPSAGEVESYVYDLDSSAKAVGHLEAFIDLVVAKSGARQVHLIAHSMGNAPLLAALDAMAKRSSARTVINQVILAAPDVDAKDFAELASRIMPLANTLTLYASSQDRAILASRKLRRDLPRAGDIVAGAPVVVSGLDSIDVSSISTAYLDLNHSTYADKKELLNDMRRLMLTGQRPPHTRDISIKLDRSGKFWRYVN